MAVERCDAVVVGAILATGFRPELRFLDPRVRLDERGFAIRSGRVASADLPGLFFVGHNFDATGGLANIRRDAPLAAEAAARMIAERRLG